MGEHNSAYLAWQDPIARVWHVVGLLREHPDGYIFNYTKGACVSEKFIKFSGMEDLGKTYISKNLFPLFKNRLLSPRRPEYPKFLEWLGINSENVSPIDVLGVSGAIRNTDKLQMFKPIKLGVNGEIEYIFFVHGLRYLSESASARVSKLVSGEKLFFCLDVQNSYDKNAIAIRTEDPAEIIGYCPRYFSRDIGNLLREDGGCVFVYVETLSEDAPVNYRLMCKIKGFVPGSVVNNFMCGGEFELIS